MKRDEIASRKYELLKTASARWKAKAPEIAATRELSKAGPLLASSAERRTSYIARETLKRTIGFPGVGLERRVGPTLDWDEFSPNEKGNVVGKPVAMLVEFTANKRVGEGFATGFVVGPGLLMTNWHVFPSAGDALGCGAQFGYQRNESGLIDSGVVFELDPGLFFYSEESIDIALVGLKTVATVGSGTLNEFGKIRLIPSQGKILVNQPVNIIEHPDGLPKRWAVRANKLYLEPKDTDLFIQYTTDTLEGSSGSPLFNYDWELIGIHHMGVAREENGQILTLGGGIWQKGMPDSEIDWVANEGARVSKVYAHLKGVNIADSAQQALLDSLLSESTDPILNAAGMLTAGPERTDRISDSLKKDITVPDNESLRTQAAESSGMRIMNITINGTANFYMDQKGSIELPEREITKVPIAIAPAVALEKKIKFDPEYKSRPGYDSKFLEGFIVPTPSAPAEELFKSGNKVVVLKYHHYSLVMHASRRLLMWAASNVDYSESKRWRSREEFGSDTWKPDPRIPIEAQIEDTEFYAPAKLFDRGHIVRRDDVAWGETKQEEEYGNSDSFHWTNCTPQHEGFNRDMFEYHGLWGQLENHIAKQAGFLQNVLSIFAGPVLDDNDPSRDFGSGIKVKVPIVFWKVVIAVEVVNETPNLRAYGFFLDQTDAIRQYGWENRFRVGKFKEIQAPLTEITDRTKVTFDQMLHDVDPMASMPNESRRRSLVNLNDIKLR